MLVFCCGKYSIESPESSKGDQISGPEEFKCFEIYRVVDGVIDSNHYDTGRYGNAYRDEAGGSYFMVFADLMHDFFGKKFANDNRLCGILNLDNDWTIACDNKNLLAKRYFG